MDNRNPSKHTYGEESRRTGSAFQEHRDTAKSAIDAAPEYYQGAIDKTSEWYESGKDSVLNFVEEKPLTALLVAGGVGFVLSMLLSKPKSNSHRRH